MQRMISKNQVQKHGLNQEKEYYLENLVSIKILSTEVKLSENCQIICQTSLQLLVLEARICTQDI